MTNTTRGLVALASAAAIAACDRPTTTAPATPTPPTAAATDPEAAQQARAEDLARRLALALGDAAFRGHVKAQLDASPIREHKLHFQQFLAADGRRGLDALARRSGAAPADVAAEAATALQLEMYLPVPAHRRAWRGGADVLVATALRDHDVPVAFDRQGNRILLDPDRPPATPVIALVPVETDFASPASFLICQVDCGGGGGGSPPPAPPSGLYMTKAHFVDDFESWLKGNPEFEAHILGQKGATDSLTDYQCAGEHAGGPYYFDQNGKDWSGSVLLYSSAQIAAYNAAHPNQNFRVLFVEDDDTACQIKADKNLLNDALKAIDGAYKALTAGNDSSRVFKRANAFQKLWAALASLINTNDEIVGNAVEDDVVGTFYPGYNWIVKGQNNVTNGWVNLEIK